MQNLYTLYTHATNVEAIESSDTYTYTQNTRKNGKGEVIGEGMKITINKPSWLSGPATPITNNIEKEIYTTGAEYLLKNMFKKLLIGKAYGAMLAESDFTPSALSNYLANLGTKLLTKESIQNELINNILPALIDSLVARNIPEAKITKAEEAYTKILLSIAAPATKFSDSAIVEKLNNLLAGCEQSPVVVAMLARINKQEAINEIDLDDML